MLDKVKLLKASIKGEQFEEVSGILGDRLYKLFLVALNSETEKDAQTNVKSFGNALEKNPITAFKLYGRLSSEQKTIIQDLME